MSKKALIVEGGGFKSAFSSGVLDVFITLGYASFDAVIGVSAGAMNLTSYLSNQYKRNYQIISKVAQDSSFVSIVRFLKGGDYLDLDQLIEIAQSNHPLNLSYLQKSLSKIDFHIVCTSVESATPIYKKANISNLINLIKASSSLPIVTRKFIEINNLKLMDGGFSDPIPAEWAYLNGFNELLIIRSNPLSYIPDKSFVDLIESVFYNDYPQFKSLIQNNAKIYKNNIDFLDSAPNDLSIIQIAPKNMLKCTTITQTPDNIIHDYYNGIESALDYINNDNI